LLGINTLVGSTPTAGSKEYGMKKGCYLDVRATDGIAALSRLCDVSLVLTDLPSGKTRAPCDEPVCLEQFWSAAQEALTDGGVVVIFASDLSFASEVLASNRKWFRHEMVWHKGRASGFLNAAHRPLRAHEYVLVFSPGKGTYNAEKTNGHPPIHHAVQQSAGANFGSIRSGTPSQAGATERYPRSVIESACVATNAAIRIHPQQKPLALMQWFVRAFSNENELVVDPCAGSGVVGAAALAEGRRFIGFERLAEYAVPAKGNWKHVIEEL
jgi:site-specific DNA-methyltransferase (adenine-specific)